MCKWEGGFQSPGVVGAEGREETERVRERVELQNSLFPSLVEPARRQLWYCLPGWQEAEEAV